MTTCSGCRKSEVRPGRKTCEGCAERVRAYYATHRDEKLAYKAAYDATHRDEQRAYKAAHRDEILAQNAAWYAKQPPEYHVWRGMIQRCYNSTGKDFEHYGGRGITVCQRWREPKGQGFKNFMADMGPRPGPDYSIDRINNDGHYEPSNCRWATAKEQANNKRPRKKSG